MAFQNWALTESLESVNVDETHVMVAAGVNAQLEGPRIIRQRKAICNTFTHVPIAPNPPSIVCLHCSHLFATLLAPEIPNQSGRKNDKLCPPLSRLYPGRDFGVLLLGEGQATFGVLCRCLDFLDTGCCSGKTATDFKNPSSFALTGEGHRAPYTAGILGRVSAFLS